MSLAEQLAPLTVLDTEKNAVTLGGLWKDKAAVLVFVRHYG